MKLYKDIDISKYDLEDHKTLKNLVYMLNDEIKKHQKSEKALLKLVDKLIEEEQVAS